MQKEIYFLSYNAENIFKSFLQAEDHLRQLQNSPDFKPGFQNCIVKHLAFAEAEADEAVSHSLVTKGKDESRAYAALRDNIALLRKKLMSGSISNDDAILGVRDSRAMFEKINPDYDLSKCQSCGSLEDTAKMAKSLKPIGSVEDDMVSKTVNFLSGKYRVAPPRIEILPSCHDPEQGLYTNKTIRLCSGGASVHVLAHEFGHYRQDLDGKSLDEAEAEKFAVEFLEKDLNVKAANYTVSERNMAVSAKLKSVAIIFGSPFLAYGASQGLTMANAKYSNAKLIGDIALAGTGFYALWKWHGTRNDSISTVLGIIGGFALVDLVVNQIPRFLAPTVGLKLTVAPNNGIVTPTVRANVPQVMGVPVIKQGSLGKYVTR